MQLFKIINDAKIYDHFNSRPASMSFLRRKTGLLVQPYTYFVSLVWSDVERDMFFLPNLLQQRQILVGKEFLTTK